jgi:hypothetical protein
MNFQTEIIAKFTEVVSESDRALALLTDDLEPLEPGLGSFFCSRRGPARESLGVDLPPENSTS